MTRKGYQAEAEARLTKRTSAWASAESTWKRWNEPDVRGGVRFRF